MPAASAPADVDGVGLEDLGDPGLEQIGRPQERVVLRTAVDEVASCREAALARRPSSGIGHGSGRLGHPTIVPAVQRRVPAPDSSTTIVGPCHEDPSTPSSRRSSMT